MSVSIRCYIYPGLHVVRHACVMTSDFQSHLYQNPRCLGHSSSTLLCLFLFTVPAAIPSNLRLLAATQDSLTFQWDAVSGISSSGHIMNYEAVLHLQQNPSSDSAMSMVISDGGNTADFHRLAPFTAYTFRVRVGNKAGYGPFSSPLTISTAESGKSCLDVTVHASESMTLT